jgi:hypothetical protein
LAYRLDLMRSLLRQPAWLLAIKTHLMQLQNQFRKRFKPVEGDFIKDICASNVKYSTHYTYGLNGIQALQVVFFV